MSYTDLIDKNIAPLQATKIGVYDANGEKVGKIELGNLKKTDLGNKLYSFGAISDIHLQYDTAQSDFQTALTYLDNNENVVFTCVCGDLTVNGTTANLQDYKNYVDTYSPNTPVYATTGNHECYQNLDFDTVLPTYTGHPVYYSFTQGNDVFIFVGLYDDTSGSLFTQAELQWLYETLEANRNKRCFVFEHVRPQDTCGNAYNIYSYDIWGGTEQTVFESLMSHYKNVILFHGHSHLRFNLQTKDNKANYENTLFGIHSIHIPSLAVPRTGDASGASSKKDIYADSEGYVVDVYENAIVLRGRDFVNAKFLPIATYCLDTTIQDVAEGTYTDSTGTIDTSDSYSISNVLSNCTNSNNATSVKKNASYIATITPNSNYAIESIIVTIGGVDITSSCVTDNNISIESVTGDIVITVTTVSTLKPCTGITLDNTSLELTSLASQTIVATVEPSDSTDSVTWESSDTSVATVSGGVVTPIVKSGTCTITARCGSQSATCNITINVPSVTTTIPLTFSVGTKIGSNGTESTSSNYAASNYVEVSNLNTYTLETVTDATLKGNSKVCFYDANKNYLSTSGVLISTATASQVSATVTLVNNAKYIRLRAYTDAVDKFQTFLDSIVLKETT